MKKFLLKIGIYGLLSLLALNALAYLSLYFLGKSSFYKAEFVKNGVAETDFDYVVLGSSTGLTTLDTKLIDSLTGKKGLNISMDDTSLSLHFLMLQHFFALGKKTKQLVLAITPWDMANDTPKMSNNDYRFLPYVRKDYVYNYYKGIETEKFNPLSFSKYFPLAGVSYYNTELFYPSLIAALKPKKKNRFDERGNYSYPDTGGFENGGQGQQLIVLSVKNPYFYKIVDFCKQNDVVLHLYLSPMYNTKTIADSSMNVINHSDLLQKNELFYDNIHVNFKGRRICSETISKQLLK